MEHGIEPLLDFHSNLPEISNYLIPVPPSESDGGLRDSVPLQTIQHKYSDIFAPLDFNPPKRDSISSSESSADLEPPSISTREESVLTVDTWLESEKQPPPTYLHITPTSDDYTAQISWIDLEADDTSPTFQRRRSSMTDFPKFVQQPWGAHETGMRTMSLRSQPIDDPEASMTPTNRKPPGCPLEIPKRRSSLGHGQPSRDINWREPYYDMPQDTSPAPPYNESHPTYEHDTGTSFLEDEVDYNVQGSANRPSINTDRGLGIASDQIGLDEWLESDLAHLAHEDQQQLLLPLGYLLQERVTSYATNFPEPLLLCDNMLVEQIRHNSQKSRYNSEGMKFDHQAMPGHQPNNQQQSKLLKWKWLGSSTSTIEKQDYSDTPSASNKQPWEVIRKVFPRDSGGLCDALYAYLLLYNYVTSLYVRLQVPSNQFAQTDMPRTIQRSGTGNSIDVEFDDEDMYMSTLPHPALPKRDKPKLPEYLGMEVEEGIPGTPSNSTRPPSRDSGGRTPTYTGLQNIPALLFNRVGQRQQRQYETRDLVTSSTMHSGHSLSRPTTPAISRVGTPSPGPDQAKLAKLRRDLAMCCARLTVTLQRTDPNSTEHKPDSECKVNPSFMRSLCENVRSSEQERARYQ
ncbi:hypothetical protein O1611_g7340 [Lasiodiplodia mahajangana]|uniref:Uncharacterized protein n=1 Tax=Lasiodiplodia mahajangana TaxID=1108764 RepID=A0ACC2JG28_9PEZI|nr:hypothetical protein O1611_g7340 [Lasiodiplodia mahajangana]